MSNSESKSEIRSLLLSSAGVAIISLTGYLIAFIYELGYTSFFGIPYTLIELSLVVILTAIGGLFLIIVCIVFCVNAIWPFFADRTSVIHRRLIAWLPFFIMYLGLLLIYGGTPQFSVTVRNIGFLLAILLFSEFIWPLLTQRRKKTYIEKLEAQENLTYSDDKSFFYWIASKPIGLAGGRLVFALFLLYLFSHSLGESAAMKQESFLTLEGKENIAVLRIYNNKFICAPFNRKSKKLDRKLIILQSSQQNELRLSWEKVGPLTLADETEE